MRSARARITSCSTNLSPATTSSTARTFTKSSPASWSRGKRSCSPHILSRRWRGLSAAPCFCTRAAWPGDLSDWEDEGKSLMDVMRETYRYRPRSRGQGTRRTGGGGIKMKKLLAAFAGLLAGRRRVSGPGDPGCVRRAGPRHVHGGDAFRRSGRGGRSHRLRSLSIQGPAFLADGLPRSAPGRCFHLVPLCAVPRGSGF